MKKKSKLSSLLKLPKIIDLNIKINLLELENEMLKDTIKDKLFKAFMDKIQEPYEIERLRKQNKNLRIKNKNLKELLKEEKNAK